MKKYIGIILTSAMIFFLGCAKEENQTVIGTEDATLEISEDSENGAIVGELPGTSNRGSVLFSIVSQEPADVLEIVDADYGVLAVANAELLNAQTTPELNLVVEVSKANVKETINVTVVVTSGCTPVDVSLWNDNLSIAAVVGNSEPNTLQRAFVGESGDCNQLIVMGMNPLDAFCFGDTEPLVLEFFPSAASDTMGTITLDQDYICGNATASVTGSGTYDINTGLIIFDYEADFGGGFTSALRIQISVMEPIICPEVDLSVWSRSVNISGGLVGSETDLGSDFAGMDDACGILNIVGLDPLGIGCSDTQSITLELIPSEDDNTIGNVSLEQDYDCEGSVLTVQGTGNYNTTTATIDIDYSVTQTDGAVVSGKLQITQETSDCFTVDTSAWQNGVSIFGGSAGFQEDLGDEFTVTADDCGVLTIEGRDPLGVACPNVERLSLILTPSATNPDEGSVSLNQIYTCAEFTLDATSDSGSYDVTEKVIVLPYQVLFPLDPNPEDGLITIRAL